MKDRILNFLANGLTATQVASLVGCSPAYISQLLGEEEFKTKLKALIIDNPADPDEKLDDKYSAVEHTLVNAIQTAIPNAELPAITMALKTVAQIRHDRFTRKNPSQNPLGNTVNMQFVQLTMPSRIVKPVPVISMNEKSEIISIDSKPMAPLSADGVRNLFARIKSLSQPTTLGVCI